jgi:hypothetical protein
LVRDLGKFGHQVIVQGDRDLRHGHIMPQIEVRFSGPVNLKERDAPLDSSQRQDRAGSRST